MKQDKAQPGVGISRKELIAARRSFQEQFAPIPLAYSTDGTTFGYEAPLDYPIPAGSYVDIRTAGGERYLGQVISKTIDMRHGPELAIDGEQRIGLALEGASVAQVTVRPEIRFIEGEGMLLGRADGSSLGQLRSTDIFQDAEFTTADGGFVNLHLQRTSDDGLDVGVATYGNEDSTVSLSTSGFGRHTFLCGQSGSGKTYSLGVVLERLLLRSGLRMVIIDPNSDFVRLGQVREDASETFVAAEIEAYENLAGDIRVFRPNPDQGEYNLSIKFGDLARQEKALVLQLDPLADREEYSSFWTIVDLLGRETVELGDVLDAAMRNPSAESRQINLRVRNLGISDWSLWCKKGERSLIDQIDDDWRAMVLDIGTLGLPAEKQVATLAFLSQLWRRRNERKPVLIVIDEAHNICPAESEDALQDLLTQFVIRIAGEGRKFGLYLLLCSQRPQKIHPNVLSQCDNLMLMRMNSSADLLYLADAFSFVPRDLLEEASHFRQGESLAAGPICATPTFLKFRRRLTREGGSDVPSDWTRKSSDW